jgi:Ca2+-binding EF-hand superfamily protein
MAEEREEHMRATFKRFDLDNSGSIDMDELLVLLDDLGLLTRLRTDPEEFVRDMFVKYDANYDGVLSFDECVQLAPLNVDARLLL